MIGLPAREETAPYYHRYIDRISSRDVVGELEKQLRELPSFFREISEEKSLHRYAADKWSIRQVLNHMNDGERLFVFRAFWFAREFSSPLPSFDQNVAISAAQADEIPWAKHIDEFLTVRQATLSFFRNLPQDAWMRTGTASDNPFTVRSLAYICAGHVAHHVAILQEKYLQVS
jgi:uncharacterized damage-inducible protein DinB